MTNRVKNPIPTSFSTTLLGWREWIALPDLGLPAIKAKVDTGARTSALHAFHIERYQKHGNNWLKFFIHPLQYNQKVVIECNAVLLDQRKVTDSGGHQEERYVIETQLRLGNLQYPIEITLTDRDDMRFRMLLGRQAILKHMRVDASASYLTQVIDAKKLYQSL